MPQKSSKSNTEPLPRMRRRFRRRAVTTAGMVVGMTMMLGFVALAIDLKVIMVYEVETRAASDAAVLAGVGELWDRTLLPAHLQQIDLPANPVRGVSYFKLQTNAAQAEARRFVMLNSVCGTPLELRDEDILFTALGTENSLTIRCPQTVGRGNPVTRIVGQALGLKSADLVVESQAVIDHRVYGFAPGAGARIPVAPIVIDPHSWHGQVGISPVVVLEIGHQSGAKGNAQVCLLSPLGDATAVSPYAALGDLGEQIEAGLSHQDLSALPGQALALDDSSVNGKLDLPLAQMPDIATLTQLGNALLAIEGQSRVWLLGSEFVGTSDDAAGRRIESFVSARVVHCELGDQTLRVVLAPSLLTTSCALVRSDQPRNPWIAKTYLVR